MSAKRIRKGGAIGIPVKFRRELGIYTDDVVEVRLEAGKIIIEPYTPRCQFCGRQELVQKFQDKCICTICAEEIVVGQLQKWWTENQEVMIPVEVMQRIQRRMEGTT